MIEAFVIDLLRRSVTPRARQQGGAFPVGYGRPFKTVAACAWLVTVAIAVVCFLPSTKIEPGAVPFLIGLFLLLALYLHSEFFFVRLTYSDANITVHTRWGSEHRVAWQDVVSVQFSKASQNYVVRLRNGKKFTFNYFMSGYQSLLDEIQQRADGRG